RAAAQKKSPAAEVSGAEPERTPAEVEHDRAVARTMHELNKGKPASAKAIFLELTGTTVEQAARKKGLTPGTLALDLANERGAAYEAKAAEIGRRLWQTDDPKTLPDYVRAAKKSKPATARAAVREPAPIEGDDVFTKPTPAATQVRLTTEIRHELQRILDEFEAQ